MTDQDVQEVERELRLRAQEKLYALRRTWTPLRQLDIDVLDRFAEDDGGDRPMAVPGWWYVVGAIFGSLLLAALAAICWKGQ